MTTNEGGVIPEEYQVLYTRDRTETVSQVWLGLTAGCAVCHDHKFDPHHPARVLRAVGVLQQHDPARHGRQHQGHAADRFGPSRCRQASLASPPRRARRRRESGSRLASRPPVADFDKWLAATDPEIA